jgi:hypothetical protein
MFNKYDNLGPADVSQGGADIINIIDEQNNIDMQAVTQNLNTLSNYQSELQTGLSNLRGQAQTLKEMQMDFAGANKVLEPHEYEAFQEHALTALEEGGLGWETTAGADVAYFKKDPTTRYVEALRITEKMQSDEDKSAQSNYAVLQGILRLGEKEDIDDLIERLEVKDSKGKVIHTPSEDVIAGIQMLVGTQPNYDEFIANLNTLRAEHGGDAIRKELMTNPNLMTTFGNLQANVRAINVLDNELAGINQSTAETNLDQFVSDISGVTDKRALFGLYDQFTTGLDPSQHEQFFNAMEVELGIGDLWPAYEEFKGFAGGARTTNLPDIEIDSALRSLEQGFALPENIFTDSLSIEQQGQAKIPGDRDYYLDDELDQFLQEEGIK